MTDNSESGKACSVCDKWYIYREFSYGKKENNSYCQACVKEYRRICAKGGTVATRTWLSEMHAK
jgi:hypothetical protein